MERKNILHICPSNEWSIRERIVFRDTMIALDSGYNVFLYCLKDSFLDKSLDGYNVEKLYLKNKWPGTFLSLWKMLIISRMIRKLNISLVHCYMYEFLFTTCFLLRSLPLVPLVISIITESRRYYKGIRYRFFLERIDRVLVPFEEMVKNIEWNMGISSKRIKVAGLGMDLFREFDGITKSFDDDFWKIAVCVDDGIKKIDAVRTLHTAIKSINANSESRKKCKLIMISENLSNQERVNLKFSEFLEAGDKILFLGIEAVFDIQKRVDLWIGIGIKQFFDDHYIMSLIAQTPVLLARSAGTMELLDRIGKVGEVYKIDDSREFRTKCGMILDDIEKYRENIKEMKVELEEIVGIPLREKQLLSSYKNVMEKRKRLHFWITKKRIKKH